MIRGHVIIVSALLALAGALTVINPQEPGEPPTDFIHPEVTGELPEATAGPNIEALGNDRFRIGALTLDRARREIRFSGSIARTEGPMEYLLCASGGKLYESVLGTDVDPYHLQLALLLIGLEPRNNLERQGDLRHAQGDPVLIRVEWEGDDARTSHRAEELLWSMTGERAMEPTHWVFTGSTFVDGTFAASLDRSIVAVFNDPAAIVNNPLQSAQDDTSFVPNQTVLPPVDTPVEIIMSAYDVQDEGS
jgi:hypothetical protein